MSPPLLNTWVLAVLFSYALSIYLDLRQYFRAKISFLAVLPKATVPFVLSFVARGLLALLPTHLMLLGVNHLPAHGLALHGGWITGVLVGVVVGTALAEGRSATWEILKESVVKARRFDRITRILFRVEHQMWARVVDAFDFQLTEEVYAIWNQPESRKAIFTLFEENKPRVVKVCFRLYPGRRGRKTWVYLGLLTGNVQANSKRAEALVDVFGLPWLRREIYALTNSRKPYIPIPDDDRRSPRPPNWYQNPPLNELATSNRTAEVIVWRLLIGL